MYLRRTAHFKLIRRPDKGLILSSLADHYESDLQREHNPGAKLPFLCIIQSSDRSVILRRMKNQILATITGEKRRSTILIGFCDRSE